MTRNTKLLQRIGLALLAVWIISGVLVPLVAIVAVMAEGMGW